MRNLLLSLVILAFPFIFVSKVSAEEKMVFDSTDTYLGACDLTDSSEWTLTRDYKVTKFEVWYRWEQGEVTLPVTIYYNGTEFAKFDAIRGSCDPYQASWCNADFQIGKTFPKGTYKTTIPNKRQCLKPGGTGAIRIYEDDSATPTVVTEEANESPTPNLISKVEATEIQPSCKQCTKTVVYTAILTSVATSLISVFLSRKIFK